MGARIYKMCVMWSIDYILGTTCLDSCTLLGSFIGMIF